MNVWEPEGGGGVADSGELLLSNKLTLYRTAEFMPADK